MSQVTLIFLGLVSTQSMVHVLLAYLLGSYCRTQPWVQRWHLAVYANIFMGTLESRILLEENPSPTHWKRYIDDIFLVWTDTKESLEQFIKSINGLQATCYAFYLLPTQGELKKKDNLTAAKESVQDELERLQVCVHS